MWYCHIRQDLLDPPNGDSFTTQNKCYGYKEFRPNNKEEYDNGADFTLKDCDGETYYKGKVWFGDDEYAEVEFLSYWANFAGCTQLYINGKREL